MGNKIPVSKSSTGKGATKAYIRKKKKGKVKWI
jgi:hypothetical protein